MVGVPVPLRAILALLRVALICRAGGRGPVIMSRSRYSRAMPPSRSRRAFDVWTEHAGAGEPIVVVVTPAGWTLSPRRASPRGVASRSR